MSEKWREMTSIEDYDFDPDGNYDGSLNQETWDAIFNDLYQRAETTEEWRYNDWIDPVSTRNAYTQYFKKGGEKYIVLKYYDGMYALYEIKDESEINESTNTKAVIRMIESGISVRQAIIESVQKTKVIEDVAGMDKESSDKLLDLMNDWIGGSGKNGWEYKSKASNNGSIFVIRVTKNPIAKFTAPVDLDINDDILNGETYHENADEYLAASGPISFAGLKSVLRDLISQVEMTTADLNDANSEPDGNIFGY